MPNKPMVNGTAVTVPPQIQLQKPSQALARQDPAAAIGLAVTQINAGKLDEADKLLTNIINESDKKAPNLGAHVARGTARALRRELEGAHLGFLCEAVTVPKCVLPMLPGSTTYQ